MFFDEQGHAACFIFAGTLVQIPVMRTHPALQRTTGNNLPHNAIAYKASGETFRKALLICGILASLLFVVMNVVAAMLYKGYDPLSQTVSELSAIDTPTRPLWFKLGIIYNLLMVAFGYGVWRSSGGSKPLRRTAILILAYAVTGFFWPPMHQREVLAAGGKTVTDTLHIVFTMITVAIMMVMIGFASTAFKRPFKVYSILSLAGLLLFGCLSSINTANVGVNAPTPWIGVWERINIGIYLLWVIVFAVILLHRKQVQ